MNLSTVSNLTDQLANAVSNNVTVTAIPCTFACAKHGLSTNFTATATAHFRLIDHGTTAFMFLATGLVQFMTPGLGFFYSGMISTQSTVAVIFQSYIAIGIVFTAWCMIVFSMTFGEPWLSFGPYNILGSPWTYLSLQGVHIYEPLQRAGAVIAPGFPGMLFMAYQGMFAVITPALISGAIVDRMRIGKWMIFLPVWMMFCYAPLGYWNWGGGWMFQLGAWDFAGGMVVHEAAGFSALGALLALGPRAAPKIDQGPHSLQLVLLGTALLWFGWFGFNGGSALTIGGLATIAFINTQLSPSVGMVTWVAFDWLWEGRPSLLGACEGAIAGLVVITPSAGFVQPSMAMLAGMLGVVACYPMSQLVKHKTNLDDPCDVLGVHGMGGFLGTIFVGMLADGDECLVKHDAPEWCANPGTVSRSWQQAGIQLLCAIVSAVWCTGMTYVIVRFMRMSGSPMKTEREQRASQDEPEFGEIAYKMRGFEEMRALGGEAGPLRQHSSSDSENETTSMLSSDQVKSKRFSPM